MDWVKIEKEATFRFEQITIADTAIGLSPDKYGSAQRAFITVNTASICFRVDGGTPEATKGHIVENGDTIELECAEDIANFKAIRTGSVSAVINVSYSN